MQLETNVVGLGSVLAAITETGPAIANKVFGPAFGAMANVVRIRAKTRNYGFTDRRGNLRRSIRSRRRPARYFGRRYLAGRASVIAGDALARQAQLVERGHKGGFGPNPVPPHPYLTRSLLETQDAQHEAFAETARTKFNSAALEARQKGSVRGATFGRVVARRGRRGR